MSIFQYLKNAYKFNPKNIMADFRISQIQAIKKYFKDATLIVAFFILVRAYGDTSKNMS